MSTDTERSTYFDKRFVRCVYGRSEIYELIYLIRLSYNRENVCIKPVFQKICSLRLYCNENFQFTKLSWKRPLTLFLIMTILAQRTGYSSKTWTVFCRWRLVLASSHRKIPIIFPVRILFTYNLNTQKHYWHEYLSTNKTSLSVSVWPVYNLTCSITFQLIYLP